MSRQLPPPPGVSIQDDTARLIRDGIVRVFKQLKTGQVWSNVRWLPDRGFPNLVHRFDLLICEPGRSYSEDGSETVLEPIAKVVTSIDVIRPERFECDWYDKPDHLEVCRLSEYCLFDPTGAFMRPRLQVWRKRDGRWHRIRTSTHGLFFSSCGFCLDTRHQIVQVVRCGRPLHEEALHVARLERARCEDPNRHLQLDEQIRTLELKVREPHRMIEDDEGSE